MKFVMLPTNYMRQQKGLIVLLFIVSILIPHGRAHAVGSAPQELTFIPVLIDEKAKARDIIKESITLINTTNRKLELYPDVNNVKPDDGTQEFKPAYNAADLENSLANWIEFSRGVIELNPGEEKTIPFVIHVNQNGAAGTYHALISFSDGSTRDEAQGKPPLGSITVNLEVQADVKEVMQLNTFSTDNVVFSGDDVLFKYQVQNIGNQELQPKGEIRIYNRKGEEVASVDVNKEGKAISPDKTEQLASVWSAVSGFGRYKALLTVDYGSGQTASVSDTVFFWIIPWKQLLGLFISTLIAIIFLALYFQRWLETRHLGKLAHAGFLNESGIKHKEEAPQTGVPLTPAMLELANTTSEHAQKVKQTYSIFRRRGFVKGPVAGISPITASSVVDASVVMNAPVVLVASTPIAREETRPTPPPGSFAARVPLVPTTPSAPARGHTIDLKQIRRPEAPPTLSDGHVIDLKNLKRL